MSELTKEHFDQVVKGLATNEALRAAVAPLATKQDLREGVEELARITSGGFELTERRFAAIDDRLHVNAEIKVFRRKFEKLEEALHIKL